MINKASAFAALGLQEINPGAWCSDSGWGAPDNARAFDAINPATEQVEARVTGASAAEYQAVIACAQRAALRWREVPAPRRGEMILRIGQLVAENMDALAQIVALDTGKSLMESKGELKEVVDMATLAAGQSRMLYGYTQQSQRAQHRMYDQWLPLGVVGIISAYNFPAAVWAQNGFLAAIGGNSVIWKPSPKVPLTAIAMQRLACQAMEEFGQPGVFSLFIPADNAVAELLVADTRVAMISFTGSSGVGKRVASIVGSTLGRRYMLECSGNNGCIVDETADLEMAAAALAFGAVGTTGQRCTSTRRVFVQRSVRERLVDLLCQAWSQVKVGNPADPQTLVGPLVDAAAVDDFATAIDQACQLGGRVAFGGKRMPGNGYFVEPTLIVDAQNHWPCVQQETFAPLLYVIEYDTLDEAIAMHNGVVQGLASGIHSTSLGNIERFLSASGSDCGIARVNMGTTGADVGAAFGGEKETGGGRTAGSDAWKGYMRRQSVCVNWGKETAWGSKFTFN
ncbi:aldehyde dehydrogenase family protein [Shimwellia pseudoproteus]|uniref:aldehyde dehydrogenase family protein n=1 Tax=Shimwellia pseudoproteus TaxID=570012 RepID=UPI0018EBC413|nr:aldehyde dehydrogenase family protein [Shimwellia pseudoproteus]MBJ3816889.1 aldehyde dehydrogenase family protein [Shimwellia pseudoproteus]